MELESWLKVIQLFFILKTMHYQHSGISTELLRDNSLWIPHFYSFCKRITDCFFILAYILKEVYIANSLGRKRKYFPLEKKEDTLHAYHPVK